MDNSFAAKYPQAAAHIGAIARGAVDTARAAGLDDATIGRAIADALGTIGWTLHKQPPPQIVKVGMAGEKSPA